MSEEMILLQKLLVGEIDTNYASSRIYTLVSRAEDASVVLPVKRAIDSFRDSKYVDFCGHLRQCLVYLHKGMEISEEVLRILEPHSRLFGFTFHSSGSRNMVNIDPYTMKDVSDLTSAFRLVRRKTGSGSVGDGELYRSYGYSNYLSFTQKLLIYLIRNQEPNETILACLPTGGGKSLAWELPSLSGRMEGMAIIVVPTVALAKDQEKRSQLSFSQAGLPSNKAVAYYGSLSDAQKKAILGDVSSGNISILYISPEALIQGKCKPAILDAAKKGFIGMLVIDEAHLVVQWGRHFRPEFQLLPALRDQIRDASPHGLKTLLLSATLTHDDTAVLKKAYVSELFTVYRADTLRTEPVYYTHKCRSARERDSLVVRLAAVSPRPLILYVATPAQANHYYELLLKRGYRNCAVFTGETSDGQKSNLIDRWRNNEVDLMIATSAFGMGVDKADIRTIITAYIPESISRFYQEVGRAGRDGYSSISYWLPYPEEDRSIVHHLTKSTVLTEEVLAIRWLSLLHSGVHASPDEVWLDMLHAPEHLMYGNTGEKNRNWNIDTVLFLSRCGLVEIKDVVSAAKDKYKILVHLLNIPVLENKDALIDHITGYRTDERAVIEDGMAHVSAMIDNPDHYCYAEYFVQDFPYAPAQCSGCPACRAVATEPYYCDAKPEVDSPKTVFFHRRPDSSDGLLSCYLSLRSEIHLVTDVPLHQENLFRCIGKLINSGVNIIIYPQDTPSEPMVKYLSTVKVSNYILLTLDEAESFALDLLDGICAVFYSDQTDYNKRLYSFCEGFLRKSKERTVVHVATGDCFIDARRKALRETVDCSVSLSSIL